MSKSLKLIFEKVVEMNFIKNKPNQFFHYVKCSFLATICIFFFASCSNDAPINYTPGIPQAIGKTSEIIVVADETIESKADTTTTVISPVAAYTVGPVVLGAAFDLVQNERKPEEGDTQNSTHNRFRPGALFADGPIEAGITYISPNNIKAEDTDELPVQEEANVTLHGRYALDSSIAVGGIITNEAHSSFDEDNLDDRQIVMGTFEMNTGDLSTPRVLFVASTFQFMPN